MKVIQGLIQGSAAWHAHRRDKWNASDAPAMLGESPHCSRTELLHRMATGIAPEVDGATQGRFNDGHAVEALLIPLAAAQLGEPLHPFVAVADFDERLSASFDGCTFVGDVVVECKLLNQRLRAAFADMETMAPEHRERSAGKSLPIDYRIQLEQQVRIADAERSLFLTGELRDGALGDVLSCWYYPDDALWARIRSGWAQFDQDLATYVPPARAAVIVAEPVQALPAVTVQVTGEIAIKDNFAAFEVAMRDFLEHRLIREPKTDQDFADLDVQIKAMKGAEAALESAEGQMLAQIQAVDSAKKTKDMLHKLVRENRLMAEKLLASEKERRKGEIVAAGVTALREHVAKLNERIGKPYMPAIPADFAGAIKGRSSLEKMEDAVASALANAKIAASDVADRIDTNLRHLREHAKDYIALFPDTATIVLKAPDDLASTVAARIAQHQAAEQKRLDAERERIRAEEVEKIEREQEAARQAELRREQEASEVRARQAAEAAKPAPTPAPVVIAAPAPVSQAPNVVPMGTRAPAAQASAPTLTLGQINDRLGRGKWSEADLTALGFPPAATRQNTKLYHDADFGRMVDSIVALYRKAQAEQLQAA